MGVGDNVLKIPFKVQAERFGKAVQHKLLGSNQLVAAFGTARA